MPFSAGPPSNPSIVKKLAVLAFALFTALAQSQETPKSVAIRAMDDAERATRANPKIKGQIDNLLVLGNLWRGIDNDRAVANLQEALKTVTDEYASAHLLESLAKVAPDKAEPAMRATEFRGWSVLVAVVALKDMQRAIALNYDPGYKETVDFGSPVRELADLSPDTAFEFVPLLKPKDQDEAWNDLACNLARSDLRRAVLAAEQIKDAEQHDRTLNTVIAWAGEKRPSEAFALLSRIKDASLRADAGLSLTPYLDSASKAKAAVFVDQACKAIRAEVRKFDSGSIYTAELINQYDTPEVRATLEHWTKLAFEPQTYKEKKFIPAEWIMAAAAMWAPIDTQRAIDLADKAIEIKSTVLFDPTCSFSAPMPGSQYSGFLTALARVEPALAAAHFRSAYSGRSVESQEFLAALIASSMGGDLSKYPAQYRAFCKSTGVQKAIDECETKILETALENNPAKVEELTPKIGKLDEFGAYYYAERAMRKVASQNPDMCVRTIEKLPASRRPELFAIVGIAIYPKDAERGLALLNHAYELAVQLESDSDRATAMLEVAQAVLGDVPRY